MQNIRNDAATLAAILIGIKCCSKSNGDLLDFASSARNLFRNGCCALCWHSNVKMSEATQDDSNQLLNQDDQAKVQLLLTGFDKYFELKKCVKTEKDILIRIKCLNCNPAKELAATLRSAFTYQEIISR